MKQPQEKHKEEFINFLLRPENQTHDAGEYNHGYEVNWKIWWNDHMLDVVTCQIKGKKMLALEAYHDCFLQDLKSTSRLITKINKISI